MQIGLNWLIGGAVILWFAIAWHVNEKTRHLDARLDEILERFDRLKDYLYEIDPQFDDERDLLKDLDDSVESGSSSFSGMSLMELTQRKKAEGRRTLNSPL